MARTRSIKPGFFDNELLGCLPPLTRLLFIGLWTQADRAGRLEDRPARLKKNILGYDDVTVSDVDGMLEELAKNDFIIRYNVAGEGYIQIVTFVKHQNPHIKEKPSDIPPPDGFVEQQPEPRQGRRKAAEEEPDEQPEPQPEEDEGQADEQPATKGTLEKRFDLFWAAYPKKKSRQDAWKAFKALKPNEDLFARIMEAIAKQRTSYNWNKEGGQFIPYPASWLRAGGWDDKEEIEIGNDSGDHPAGHTGRGLQTPSASIDGFKPAGE